jgi:pimeloyl-ACP methyl ester carboxylesterase
MTFTEKSYFGFHESGQHEIYYNDWGPKDGNPVICVHGLTGNGYDFDFLAEDLIKHGHRLIAVDLPGRGRSDFHADPLLYNYDQYLRDLHELLAHLDLQAPGSVDWLGVSLGGLLGMRMAALEHSPIKRLIINDVGPEVPQAALDFIYQVISQNYAFDTVADLEQRMRATRGLTWGPVTDEQWRHMAEHNARARDDGRITYAYDPQIARVFESEPIGDEDLWDCWGAIACPVLVIQGADSMLLTDDIVDEMAEIREFDLAVFEGCGHVPSLMAPEQIKIVRAWLSRESEDA